MGDGDCCSIGTAHWIHALRYNMNMTALMLDNGIYGLTKNQASPTSPLGLVSNTTPRGSSLEPINPLSVSLSVSNASFVAQTADWIPDLTHDIIQQAFRHRGFAFVRVVQRCPEFLGTRYDPWIQDPARMLLLAHPDGIQINPALSRIYPTQEQHDPADMARAREIATLSDPIPVGVLYRNENIPCYEDFQAVDAAPTPAEITRYLESEFDKFAINPLGASTQ
jgi:2-oxoglutarate ferredoxin oxidoreductase subunit beta